MLPRLCMYSLESKHPKKTVVSTLVDVSCINDEYRDIIDEFDERTTTIQHAHALKRIFH